MRLHQIPSSAKAARHKGSTRAARHSGFWATESCMKKCSRTTARSQVRRSQHFMGARHAKAVVSTCFQVRMSINQVDDHPSAMRCVAFAMVLAWHRPHVNKSKRTLRDSSGEACWVILQSPCGRPLKVLDAYAGSQKSSHGAVILQGFSEKQLLSTTCKEHGFVVATLIGVQMRFVGPLGRPAATRNHKACAVAALCRCCWW